MRLSDARLRRSKKKLIYPNHRLPSLAHRRRHPRSLEPIVRSGPYGAYRATTTAIFASRSFKECQFSSGSSACTLSTPVGTAQGDGWVFRYWARRRMIRSSSEGGKPEPKMYPERRARVDVRSLHPRRPSSTPASRKTFALSVCPVSSRSSSATATAPVSAA